jgi:signal transduction histidine kinase
MTKSARTVATGALRRTFSRESVCADPALPPRRVLWQRPSLGAWARRVSRVGFWLAWLWLPHSVLGVPVKLHAVEASAPALKGHPLDAAVDGVFTPDNGWSIQEGQTTQQFAIFATEKPILATMIQARFFFLDPLTNSSLVDFGVSVTTDERPSIPSRWRPLLPEIATANDTNDVRITGRTVRLTSYRSGTIVTILARAPFQGITGFRLRLHPLDWSGTGARPTIGCGPDGNFMLTEFDVEAEPLRTSNIALGRQVYASGAVPAAFPKKNLTDGLISTYSHPDASLKDKPFAFTLHFGRELALDHIVVRTRADGSDLERLGEYLVEVLDDPGGPGLEVKWHALLHADGSHVPVGGADVIHATDGQGVFSGNMVRIHNSPPGNPQLEIAELEVYPALSVETRDWIADNLALGQAKKIAVPAGTHKLAFTMACRTPDVDPLALAYRWRIAKLSDQWHETGPDGRVELVPPPPPGSFDLQVQARHTDGVWDKSSYSVELHVAEVWWHNPMMLALAAAVIGILGAAVWWKTWAWRVNRRLAVAEQHLELHQERLRIARDMHDEMGARLTHIALLADRTRKANSADVKFGCELKEVAENARAAVSALDNIVWAVSPQHDTIGSMVDYLCDYAPSYLEAAGMQCRLEINVVTPHYPLSLTIRHALLMAVKEALQNAVKHSQASTVRLSIREADGTLLISIADDGRGFPDEPVRIDSSGLKNMRQRLTEIGGRCEMGAADGQGARIQFFLPMKYEPKQS